MRYFWILAIVAILAGCAHHGPVSPGTQMWYNMRMTELDASYRAQKLTTQQYTELKNGIDAIREYYDRHYYHDPWTPPSYWGPGYRHHR
jgi:hypothetical protein